MIPRRAFLAGLASLAAPALVRAASLDYVPRGLVLPPEPTWRSVTANEATGMLRWEVHTATGRVVSSGVQPVSDDMITISGEGLSPGVEYRVRAFLA